MASPLLRYFTVENSKAYQTPTPEVRSFAAESGGSENSPTVQQFVAETSNAYKTPTPEVRGFAAESGGAEVNPLLQMFAAETSNSYNTPTPEVRSFAVEMLLFPGGGMGLKGKQVVLGTIGDDRLMLPYIRSDGGRVYSASQDMGGFKITNHALPTALTDVATKAYVDGAVAEFSTTPVTLTTSNRIVYLNTTSTAITVNLPALSGADNHEFIIHTVAGGSNNVTLDPNGSETIGDQAAAATTRVYSGLVTKRIRAKGSGSNQAWYVIA